jgi:hypothetical protein
VGGSGEYYNKLGPLNLIKENYLIFIIYNGFIIGKSSTVYTGNKVRYYINNESVFTLEKETALIIITDL